MDEPDTLSGRKTFPDSSATIAPLEMMMLGTLCIKTEILLGYNGTRSLGVCSWDMQPDSYHNIMLVKDKKSFYTHYSIIVILHFKVIHFKVKLQAVTIKILE